MLDFEVTKQHLIFLSEYSWFLSFLLSSLLSILLYRALTAFSTVDINNKGNLLKLWLNSVRVPCYFILFMLWAGFNASTLLFYYSGSNSLSLFYLSRCIELATTLLISWFVLLSIGFAEDRVNNDAEQLDPKAESTVYIAFQIAKMLVYVFVAVAILSILDLHELAVSIFTAGAVGTVLIGLAAREALSNVFSSLMLLCDRPFKPKDFIALPENNIEGTVESVGWRITKIRRPDKKVQYVPNLLFSTASVVNYSQMSQRRIRHHFGLRYADLTKVKVICDALEQSFADFDFVDKRVDSFVCLHDFEDSQVVIRLQVFTKPCTFKSFNKAVDTVLHKVVECIHAAGADFAFPTTTLDAKDLVSVLKENVDK